MSLPENDYQILKLTEDFYKAYPNPPYREILKKKQRAYNVCFFSRIMIILFAFHIELRLDISMRSILQLRKDLKCTSPD